LPLLTWSDELADFANTWLLELDAEFQEAVLHGKPLTLKHRPVDGEFAQKYGEDIAYWSGTHVDIPGAECSPAAGAAELVVVAQVLRYNVFEVPLSHPGRRPMCDINMS
jgi:hypothetical protein